MVNIHGEMLENSNKYISLFYKTCLKIIKILFIESILRLIKFTVKLYS